MKKYLIIYGIIILGLTSCEDENTITETEPSQITGSDELFESTLLLDGNTVTVYSDESGNPPMIKENGTLISIEELSENGDLVFYGSIEFEGYAVFTSKERLNEMLNSPVMLDELNQKMLALNPIEKETSSVGLTSSGSSLTPSVTIASAHSFGGHVFTKTLNSPGVITWYSNPHLRCNQWETNCVNFNDIISSVRVVNAVAEFFEGSFTGQGKNIYLNALGGTIEIRNLQDVRLSQGCTLFCQSFNDKITSFWADRAFRSSRDLGGLFIGSTSCSHNYQDPQCGGGGSGGGGSGGGGGGGGGGPLPIQ